MNVNNTDDTGGCYNVDGGTSKLGKFNPNIVIFLIRLMQDEIDSGRATINEWNKTSWPNMSKTFNSYFNTKFSTGQLKSLACRLRKDYKTLYYLKMHTVFGWNEALKVPVATDEQWEQAHNIRGNAMKFRTNTLMFYDELHRLWGAKVKSVSLRPTPHSVLKT